MSQGRLRIREASWISVAAALVKALSSSQGRDVEALNEAKQASGFEVATLRRAMKAFLFLKERAGVSGMAPELMNAPMSSIEVLERLARKAPRVAAAALPDVLAGKTTYRELLRMEKASDLLFGRAFDDAMLKSVLDDEGYSLLAPDEPQSSLPSVALRPDYAARAASGSLGVYLSPRFAASLRNGDSVEVVLAVALASMSFFDRVMYCAASLDDELDVRVVLDRVSQPVRFCLDVRTSFVDYDH